MRNISPWQTALVLAFAATSLHAPSAFAAPLVDHFSQTDCDAYVEAAVRTLGDAASSLADKDYAVRLLDALGNQSVAWGFKSSACAAAAAGLSSGDLAQIHHGISLGNGIGGCANAQTWRASEQVAEAVKNVDLYSLYHAVLAAPLLGVNIGGGGHVLEKVLDLIESDGSVRSYPDGPVEAGNAFMAGELLAALAPFATGDAKAIALRRVEHMKSKVLEAEPGLLVQLNRAAGGNLSIKAAKLKSMARDLLEASRTSLPKSMLGIYEALKAIESYPKAPLPIKLKPSSPSVEELSSGAVSLLVTSVLGSPTKVKSASLASLDRADGSDALGGGEGGNRPLGAPDADGFRAIPAVEVAAGVYTAGFAVEIEGGDIALAAKLPVAVRSTAELAQARVSVSESKDKPSSFASAAAAASMSIESFVLSQPGKTVLPGHARASAVEGHHLHVELSLRGAAGAGSAAPHQVFVRFTHAKTGLDTFFVAAPVEGGNAGEFSVSVSLAEESQTFLQRSGAYEMTALVGGPLVTPPISETLGAMELRFSEAKERKWPLYARALLHETDVSLGPLPEKHHTFRDPVVRPHAGVSIFFTVLAVAPLAALAYGMRRGGANLRRLPASTTGKAWCAAYQACMVSVVLLFVTYWVALTMAYTLKMLTVLSVVTTLTGRKALQALAAEAEGGKGGSRGGGPGRDEADSVDHTPKVD